MDLRNDEITTIIIKYINGTYSQSEKDRLDEWLAFDKKNQELLNDLLSSTSLQKNLIEYNSFDEEGGWQKVKSRLSNEKNKVIRFKSNTFYYAAAVVLVLIGFSLFYYQNLNNYTIDREGLVAGKILKNDKGEILPATNGAFIITPSGEKMSIKDDFKIDSSGKLLISDAYVNSESPNQLDYYELIVPKAKFIQFTLFDGSKIWVNANSHLKIPIKLKDNARRLEIINGEVYLEVEKYNNTEFIVDTKNGSVEVLGTKFNVNSYKSQFKTTLIEGSVKLNYENQQKILTPNNAGVLLNNDLVIVKADINSDLAWKNNVFYFHNFSINKIARQIENWYGVKVSVDEKVSKNNNTYSGELRRDVPLTEVKEMLEYISGLKVNIQDEQLNIDN